MYSDDYNDDYDKTPFVPMNCFDNIIGVKRTCDSTEPVSGLYLNDLAGLTIKDADASISDEYASGLRMIKSKINLATALIINHLRAGSTKLLAYSTIENGVCGIYTQKEIIPAQDGKLKGIQLKLKNYPYFSVLISSISFYAHETKSINIYIYDLVTGKLLDTFPVMTNDGSVTSVIVNKKYGIESKTIELFICADSDISFNQAILSKGHCNGCTNTHANAYTYLTYSETSLSEVITANLQGGTSTGGISFSYSLECSIEPFICSMAGTMGMPILYKSAALVMEELAVSKRQNSIITIYKETHEELHAKYEGEYQAALGAIFNHMKTPNDMCFHCNSSIKNVAIAP